jgi:flagellar motor switch protein FliG
MAKIEFEIDDEIAGKLGEFTSSTGIPVETLCSLFVRKVASEQRIPFEVSVKRKSFLGESFRNTDPAVLSRVLQSSGDSVCASVLSSLDSGKAAILMESFPVERQANIFSIMSMGGGFSKSVMEAIEKSVLSEVVDEQNKESASSFDIESSARIFSAMNYNSCEKVLPLIQKLSPETFSELDKRIFRFEDIVLLDDRSIQKMLRELDSVELAKALKGADSEVCDKIYRNMSKRSATMLEEEIEYLGHIGIGKINEAKQKIVSVIRRLEESGEVVIVRPGEYEDFI